MDYTQAGRLFQIRKVLRYIALYGPSRTLVKVRGQLHMKKRYAKLPQIRTKSSSKHVGLIGCGNYCFSNIAYYLYKKRGAIIRAAMDVNIDRAASLFESYKLDYYTNDASRIIDDKQIDLVYIASNHASHAEYAIQCLNAGKSVHIEKPHVVDEDQLRRLCESMASNPGKVALGFNRPHSRIGLAVRAALAAQRGASMLNWFVAGHEIDPDHWYYKVEEGGRVLGNMCHWTDFIYHCIEPESRYPIVINPTRAEKSDCDVAVTFTFGDGSIAAITFSAKGHTFEGVRERFSAHRGDVLISMDDFRTLTIETVASKRKVSGLHRDQGHMRSILSTYDASSGPAPTELGLPVSYIWESGELFLKTREALDQNRKVTVFPYSQSSAARTLQQAN